MNRYDVFIAYHGSYGADGSQKQAEQLARFLIDKGLTVYFFPFDEKKDAYKTNIFEVMNSDTLVLVTNEKIHRDKKQISREHHYELSVELDSFYSCTFLDDNKKTSLDAKVLFVGEYNRSFRKGDEANLHPLFKDRTHFSFERNDPQHSYDLIHDWIRSRVVPDTSRQTTSNEVLKVYGKRPSMLYGEKVNEKILGAKKVICIGMSNTDFTTRIDPGDILAAIQKGATVELFFLDPDGMFTGIREKEEGFSDERIKKTTENNMRVAKTFKHELPQEYKQNYRIFTYDLPPRLNIVFLDDFLFLNFYGFISRGMDTPSFVIQKQRELSPIYDYCKKSYEYIKSNSKEIE